LASPKQRHFRVVKIPSVLTVKPDGVLELKLWEGTLQFFNFGSQIKNGRQLQEGELYLTQKLIMQLT
jgi:hypothetical protein